MLNVALPKGRLGNQVYDLLEKAGYDCPGIREEGRRLLFDSGDGSIRCFWVKPSDVSIYVERGAADVGVCGKDILAENRPRIYELLDLKVGKCRMAVAAPKGWREPEDRPLRVGTSFPNIVRDHYAALGRDVDLIHLHGSVELAPLLGLSDVIVDIVETGSTLRANGLEVIDEILPISARLIANRASFQFKLEEIQRITERLKGQVENG
jgi:ATP phosphoribosyltransferase